MSRVSVPAPVISAWAAVSPFGIGVGDFAAGLRSGRPVLSAPGDVDGVPPGQSVGMVPDFVQRDVLGRRGTRGMDRLTGLAVVAAGHLVGAGDLPPGERVAVVLGTTTGSQQSMSDITRDTLIHEKPFYIETAHIPNAIMNSSAGQCAMRYGLRGPNATVAAGRTSTLSALMYARRLLAADRARTVLCGAAEEFSSARAWWEWRAGSLTNGAPPLGEGCVLLRLDAGSGGAVADGASGDPAAPVRAELARLVAVEFATHDGRSPAQAVELCVRRALDRAGILGEDVWAIAAGTSTQGPDTTEWEVLDKLFAGHQPYRVDCLAAVGDTGAACAGFQLAAVLAEATWTSGVQGRHAVITALDSDGSAGCAVVQLC
ncbi:beta-ketoacyl synthase N-terminal-like domain-containing protein [Micromonospora sp. WMMD1120]|uniref:beta-ketoacyl synthase N-terminal-like domain-containing protein n=1 Tax=Micromonospora sp. WMMD1120 TaxID=3016106 RepID=UPI0024160F70|nr:beta-ketoacyl synthase N-terminal-like domain-containing protein [Micromonospora sp. WMMD1120]MDG4810807.1 beta-ketoacyl synthase N-terminal-like domain-containing protein [Micromonospora sp. WMMD1120]